MSQPASFAPPARDQSPRRGSLTEVPSPPVAQTGSQGHFPGADAPSPMMRRAAKQLPKIVQGMEFGPANDGFQLGDHLGKGGQGTVHSCVRMKTSNKYAVKIIDIEGLNFAKKHRENLRCEIRNMSELHHPRIVNLHCAFWELGCCFLVLDLAKGGDLHQQIENEVRHTRVLPFKGLGGCEDASRHVTQQVLDGIEYMHSRHVIHRDLKLENILIHKTEQGPVCELHDIKIADLGLSKYVGPATSSGNLAPTVPVVGQAKMTKRFSVVGSPDFVAPEVLEQVYDERADLWSLGVMVYAMFCGQWPFHIKSAACLRPDVHKTIVSTLRSTSSWLLVSEHGKSFVEGLLKVRPDDRLSVDGCKAHLWLQSGSGSCGEMSEPRDFQDGGGVAGVVKRITASLGAAVDTLELKLWNGSKEKHGAVGGESKTVVELKDDELIIGVVQETLGQYLGNGVCFYTSHSRVVNLPGWSAQRQQRFVAPLGRQITGLQFDGSKLIGIHLEKVCKSCGAVEEISGTVGHAVDRVSLKMRDGLVLQYGSAGGTQHSSFVLDPHEYITVVEQGQRDAFLGNSIVFYTSTGSVIRFLGMQSAAGVRVSVPAGSQLCGLEFSGGDLDTVYVCPASGDVSRRQALRVG